MTRRVLLSYLDRNKPVIVPQDTESDISFLRKQFLRSFNYSKNVRLVVTFQRFDNEWNEYVDLEEDGVTSL